MAGVDVSYALFLKAECFSVPPMPVPDGQTNESGSLALRRST